MQYQGVRERGMVCGVEEDRVLRGRQGHCHP